MHQIIPSRTMFPAGTSHLPPAITTTTTVTGAAFDGGSGEPKGVDPPNVIRMVSESAVIIIGRRGCCMCHVAQRLLQSLGVNPTMYEVDEDHEAAVSSELSRKIDYGGEGGGTVQFPAVFVGGKLFGGLERVVATHISGELVPILKDAGALWL